MKHSGLARKLFRRLDDNRPNNKILIVSIQKCGTHLIQKLMSEAGFEGIGVGKDCTLADFDNLKPNQYLWSHHPPSDDILSLIEAGDKSLRLILNYRDPRDAIVSWLHWMHPKNLRVSHLPREYIKKTYASFSDEQLLEIFIKGDKFRPIEYNVIEYFRLCRALLFHPRVHKVKFEDLVGAKGGGNEDVQLQTVKDVFDYLGVSGIDSGRIARNLFDTKSDTFRKGLTGEHQHVFSPKIMKFFHDLHSDLLSQYGYSINEDN